MEMTNKGSSPISILLMPPLHRVREELGMSTPAPDELSVLGSLPFTKTSASQTQRPLLIRLCDTGKDVY